MCFDKISVVMYSVQFSNLDLTLSYLMLCVQWMAGGSHGLCGQAVLKPVVGGASRGTGFVMGPFLGGSPVLEIEKRCDAAMRRDAQVSRWERGQLYPQYFTIYVTLFSKAYFLSVLSSALWDLCWGQLLQCCVEDDPSRGHSSCTLSSQCHGYVQTTATLKTVHGWLEALFDDKDPCICVVQQYTGLILRRCTLDEEGIAYWENPTYMKCISNDYRSIQTLVSIGEKFYINRPFNIFYCSANINLN